MLYDISNTALVAALFTYIAAFVIFAIGITGSGFGRRDPAGHRRRWGRFGFAAAMVGLVFHVVYFAVRWVANGFIPVSNLFEFMTFLSMMIMTAFAVIYWIYRKPLLGAFATPVGFIILAYAMVFPWEAQPLIPALDNNIWLYLHVTTAAAGEGFFAIAFAAGLMYLLRVVDFARTERDVRRQQRWVEFTLYSVLLVVGFIAAAFVFRGIGYEAVFAAPASGQNGAAAATETYSMPPIASPHGMEPVSVDAFLGADRPLFETPAWLKGVGAGRKLNTLLWAVIFGTVLYALLRLLFRKPLGAVIHPLLRDIDPDDLDEIAYRAVAIGFPIFTLGALIFAMIWAHIAWNRFWGWDPKEVWALITWLFYAAYLHLRLGRGWIGRRSAWLAVIGFIVVMFTLIGVNLLIAGLHSYAGV